VGLFLQVPYDIGKLALGGRTMDRGQMVQVTEYGGNKLIRRVIADKGEVIVICNEQEFRNALREKREPNGIGFPRKSVQPYPVTAS
jgi:hypothetical protein